MMFSYGRVNYYARGENNLFMWTCCNTSTVHCCLQIAMQILLPDVATTFFAARLNNTAQHETFCLARPDGSPYVGSDRPAVCVAAIAQAGAVTSAFDAVASVSALHCLFSPVVHLL